MIQLEISKTEDKRLIMAILADNGYTVRKGTVVVGNRKKAVVEAWKDEKKATTE